MKNGPHHKTVRVYELARSLEVTIERILALCRQAGIETKNELSILTDKQSRMIERLDKKRPS
jgi:hypothetical protein